MNLLPTTHTVELEERTSIANFRVNWRPVILLTVVLAVVVAGILVQRRDRDAGFANNTGNQPQTTSPSGPPGRAAGGDAAASRALDSALTANLPTAAPTPPGARPREIVVPIYPNRPAPSSAENRGESLRSADAPDTSALPLESDLSSASAREQVTESAPIVFTVRVSSDGIVPIVPGMVSYESARRELQIFLNAGEKGLWWELTEYVHNSPAFDDPALWPLRDAELAASRAWRAYSDVFGQPNAAAEREFAQLLTNRVYQYVSTPTN